MRNGIKRSFGALLLVLFGFSAYTSASYSNTYIVNEENIIQVTNGTNETFELLPNMNFNLGGEYNAISVASTLSYETLYNVFWNNNKLYVISSKYGRRPQNPISQGYYSTYCQTSLSGNCCGQYGYQANVITGAFESGYSIEDDRYKNPSSMSLWSKQYAGGSYDQWLEMCFNYNDLQISNCFCYDRNYPENGSVITGSIGITTNQYYSTWGNNDFSEYFSDSPFAGGGGNGEETETQNNYYNCPTIQQLINTYPSQYNTGLCYSSNLIFSGGTIQTVTPKSIFELYPYLTGFMRDIDLYNNYCTAPNTTSTCQTAFEGKEEQYTLISKAMNNNINKMKLYQYCNLQLNFDDKNATTCVSTGIYATGVQENITTQDIANALINEDYQTILPTTTGTVFEELIGEDEERKVNWNILESIENIYTKITSIFQGRSGTEGIIPEYITRMILVICLFALFKK